MPFEPSQEDRRVLGCQRHLPEVSSTAGAVAPEAGTGGPQGEGPKRGRA